MPNRRHKHVPTVPSQRLTEELRRLREHSGLTNDQAVTKLQERGEGRWSAGKLSRIENDKQALTLPDLRRLLDLYGAARDERVALETLARDAREEEWWHRYRDLPEWFQVFLSLEDDACVERLYDTHLVPGLFQIPSYAEAVIRAWRPTIPHREVQHRVDVRMKRQALLDKTEALELWTIIDESVLHRVVGSTEVMAEQLTHLIEVANRPNVTLQVLPFSAGASPAMGRSFVVLEFPAATDPIVYVEVIAGGLYHRSPDDVARHRLIYEHLQASALSEPASVELIAQVLRNHSP